LFFKTRISGLYSKQCSLNFDPEEEIPSMESVWVKLPYLLLNLKDGQMLESIGNKMRRIRDKAEPKSNMHACACICVEVNLDVSFSREIALQINNLCHVERLDYEQCPFKCNS